MKVISLISQKGGVGKTTLATALAVAAHQNGERPVLIDLDPQASASFWKDTRQDDAIAVTAVPAARIQHVLKAAESAGAQIAIIDTPPFAKDIAYEAAQHADFVLIPTRPAVLDVMAMTRTVELITMPLPNRKSTIVSTRHAMSFSITTSLRVVSVG